MKMICTIMLILLTSASHAQDDDRQKIQALSAGFSRNYVTGDYGAMADAYTVDAILMAPGRDIIYGRENIYKFWSASGSRPAMHRVVSDTLIFSENVVHDFGYYFTQSEEDGPVFSAKYYIIWKKDGHSDWRMSMDMWNSRQRDWQSGPAAR